MIMVMPAVVVMVMVMIVVMIVVMSTIVVAILVFVVIFKQECDFGCHIDVLKWQIMGSGDFGTVIIFWRENRGFIRPPAKLAFDWPEIGFHRVDHPLTYGPLDQLTANSERTCFIEDDCLQRRSVVWIADDTQDHTRAILLHLNRCRVDIQRACCQQGSLGVADHFSSGVVKIGFQQHHSVRRTCCRA